MRANLNCAALSPTRPQSDAAAAVRNPIVAAWECAGSREVKGPNGTRGEKGPNVTRVVGTQFSVREADAQLKNLGGFSPWSS